MAPNCPEWVLLEFGAALAGLTLVTVNPALRPREVGYVLGQSRAAVVSDGAPSRNSSVPSRDSTRSGVDRPQRLGRHSLPFVAVGACPGRESHACPPLTSRIDSAKHGIQVTQSPFGDEASRGGGGAAGTVPD